MTNQTLCRFERQSDLVPGEELVKHLPTVIGVGAIGRQVAIQLAAIGAPRVIVIDFDVVEPSNVTTQGYRLSCDIGKSKVDAVSASMKEIDPAIEVITYNSRWNPRVSVGDVIFCCVDSIGARRTIWEKLNPTFWVDGRMLGEVIRVLTADSFSSREEYAKTLFDESEAIRGRCTNRSTVYAASVAAGLMVHQYTRFLRGIPTDRDVMVNLLASELVTL